MNFLKQQLLPTSARRWHLFKHNHVSHNELLVQGFWGRKRIGDQLPNEYVPE
jgi:hypothetical protein